MAKIIKKITYIDTRYDTGLTGGKIMFLESYGGADQMFKKINELVVANNFLSKKIKELEKNGNKT